MGYKIDHDYEIDAIVMNRKPDNCEVCPLYGYSIKGDDIGCCTVLDIQMATDSAWRRRLNVCPIKTREETEARA